VQIFDLSEDEEEIAVGSAKPGKKQEDNDDEEEEELPIVDLLVKRRKGSKTAPAPAPATATAKKKQVSLPGASILFQRPTIPFHLIEPHSRRALNAPVELPDNNPQGMINPNHPNHYLWVEMCNQLHTPITGSSGLQE
jgi:hypothetical protein